MRTFGKAALAAIFASSALLAACDTNDGPVEELAPADPDDLRIRRHIRSGRRTLASGQHEFLACRLALQHLGAFNLLPGQGVFVSEHGGGTITLTRLA